MTEDTNKLGAEPASQYFPKPSSAAETPNELGKSLQEWWDSDACKKLQRETEEAKQRAVGKYFMLSESDKIDMVQAICYIMCKAEREGTSHRGLQDALGIYPSGFWVDHLMEVHNALWSYYHDQKQKEELEKEIQDLQNFVETKIKPKEMNT